MTSSRPGEGGPTVESIERSTPERELVVAPRRVGGTGGRRGSRLGVIAIVIAAVAIVAVGLWGSSVERLIRTTVAPSTAVRPSQAPPQPSPSPQATRPHSTPFGAGVTTVPGTWRPITEGVIGTRVGHTAVWTGDEVLVWGGDSGTDDVGAAYDPSSDSWRLMRPPPIQPRTGQVATWTGHEMLVWGGNALPDRTEGGSGPGIDATSGPRFDDGAAYDPATDTWRTLPRSGLPGRGVTAAAWTGSVWVVIDGLTSGDADVELGVAAYDPAYDRWSSLPSVTVPMGRAITAVSTPIGVVLLTDSDATQPTAWLLTQDGSWQGQGPPSFNDLPPGIGAVSTGATVLVPGLGEGVDPAFGQGFSDAGLYALHLDGSGWEKVTGPNGVDNISPSTPVWTGVEAIVGDQSYDPVGGRWRTLSQDGAWPRDGATSTWAGDRLVIWGGSPDPSDLPIGTVFAPDIVQVDAPGGLPWVSSTRVTIEDRSGRLVSARPATTAEVQALTPTLPETSPFHLHRVAGDDHAVSVVFFDAGPTTARLEIPPDASGLALRAVPTMTEEEAAVHGLVLTFDAPIDSLPLAADLSD